MTSSRSLVGVCSFLLLLGSPAVVHASHNLLANGDFTTGITGWMLADATGTALDWDPVAGDPHPGALRLAGSGAGFVAGQALSECFEQPPGTILQVRASVLSNVEAGSTYCVPYISTYRLAGCTGERSFRGFSGPGPRPNPVGVWEVRSSRQEITPRAPSFRVSLLFDRLTGDGPASCHFDSVELFEPGTEAVVEVPALDGLGLLLLVAALGLSAVWVLRRP